MFFLFFFKQKTAYEMRISDWSSDVCSSDLREDDDGEEALMAKKHIPAEAGDRGRLEVVFDKPHLLGSLFGEYDQNLVAIENRLGVYIAARGNKLQIEGEAEAAARARDVLDRKSTRLNSSH